MTPLAFTSGFTSILFSVATFVWLLAELFGAFLIPYLRRRGQPRTKRDRGSGILIMLSIYVSLTITFVLGRQDVTPLPDWVFYLGVVLIFLGIIVRQYSIFVLGRFFSLAVSVADDHRVVDQGPYRFVRHPSYTGALLTLTGLGLGVQSLLAVILMWIIFSISFGYRIHVEESMLTMRLGAQYLDYKRRTKMLIPYLL